MAVTRDRATVDITACGWYDDGSAYADVRIKNDTSSRKDIEVRVDYLVDGSQFASGADDLSLDGNQTGTRTVDSDDGSLDAGVKPVQCQVTGVDVSNPL